MKKNRFQLDFSSPLDLLIQVVICTTFWDNDLICGMIGFGEAEYSREIMGGGNYEELPGSGCHSGRHEWLMSAGRRLRLSRVRIFFWVDFPVKFLGFCG
jgi:hypothetical protein